MWFAVKMGMIGSAALVLAGLLHIAWKRWRRAVAE